MSPWIATTIITWVALIIVYLGLAATLRRVNQLQAELASLRASGRGGVRLRLPGYSGVVLAADASCDACHVAVGELASLAPSSTLLSYEPWDGTDLRVRVDTEAWRSLAHLSPPVLMAVDADGQVTDIALPTNPGDVAKALQSWGTPVLERLG
ncbi:hypothetical protein [Allorhizocola rhizosphaerae]|uniref:hypothetical protein n=1 Tax=Allorhizocola rhizosphaerae TaxID=1872709 RepID=UPI000E3D0F8E|nr:hypothetical protein [Allorhizocola rhizosphaerae]